VPSKFDGDVVTDVGLDFLGLVPAGDSAFGDSTDSGDDVAVELFNGFANIGGDSFEEWGEGYGLGYWEFVGSLPIPIVFSLCFSAAGASASVSVACPGAVGGGCLGDWLQHFSDRSGFAA
jgi:hypothetical protein